MLTLLDHKTAQTQLTDSIYNFHMQGTEELVGLISTIDQIKHQMVYSLDERGRFKEILNKKDLIEKWQNFRGHLEENPYIQKLNQESKKKILEAGDTEFSLSNNLLFKSSYSNLFNQIIFGQYLLHDLENFQGDIIKTQSHFFPSITFDVNCETKNKPKMMKPLPTSTKVNLCM